MADYYMNRDIDSSLSPFFNRIIVKVDSAPFTWWQPKVGKRIKLTKMKKSHIINSIKMIERRGNWRQQWLEPLQKELKSR